MPPYSPTDATINAVLLHQRLWISFYCIYLFTIFFVFWTFSLTYFITSRRFECMIKSAEFKQTRLNIIFVVVSIVQIGLVVTYGILANNNQGVDSKQDNYIPRYFLASIYLMTLVSVGFLLSALRRLYVVMKNECANKLSVNNDAILVHLVCFSFYALTILVSICTSAFGVTWINSYKGRTSIFISAFVFSQISQLVIIYIFYQISVTVKKL